MKSGKLIEYNKKTIFLQKSCRKWGRKASSRPLFVFEKVLYELKASGSQQINFNIGKVLILKNTAQKTEVFHLGFLQ